MSERILLLRKSTGEIINYNANYPRADLSEPVEGLDPDLQYLVWCEPFLVPDYDSRIYQLVVTEEVTTEPWNGYNHLHQYRVTFSTQKRENTDIEKSILNAERQANGTLLPDEKLLKEIILDIGVLFRANDDMILNAKEQVLKDRAIARAVRVWKNDQTTRDKLAQLAANEEPEIDAGWEKDE